MLRRLSVSQACVSICSPQLAQTLDVNVDGLGAEGSPSAPICKELKSALSGA